MADMMQGLGHRIEGSLLPTQTPTMHLVVTTGLLALNTTQLEAKLIEELATNPALELIEDHRCPKCGRVLTGLHCPHCQAASANVEFYELPSYTPRASRDPSDYDDDWSAMEAMPVSLADYVWGQLAPTLSAEEKPIGRYLVDRLDAHGLLPESPAEIAAYLNRPLPVVQRVLRALQQTEPVGVGAANVRECLRLQLEHLQEQGQGREWGPGHYTALALVNHAWDALVQCDLAAAARIVGCEADDVAEAIEFIHSNLYPRPADTNWSDQRHPTRPPETLHEPDVVIRQLHNPDRLAVEMHGPCPSWFRVNPVYRDLAREARAASNGDGPPAWAVLADQAELLIKSLMQRNQTMRLVVEQLVKIQHDFILKGDRYLTPLTRAELAGQVGVHESTVSRAVSGKTIALPSGRVVEMAIFFDRSLSVRDRVRELINNEKAEAPLSDGQIAALLRQEGVDIARRTVAKYRNALKIAPANLRHNHTTAA